MKKLVLISLFLCAVGMLSACGGGGSNSGGPRIVFQVGVYEGVQNLTLSIPGNPDTTFSFLFSLTATETTVTIFDPSFSGSSSITQNGQYMVSITDIPIRVNDTTCPMDLDYSGTAVGNITNGTISGSVTCPDFPPGFIISIIGSFEGMLTSGNASQAVYTVNDLNITVSEF